MNIIKHLTKEVSSIVIKNDTSHGEIALMEKFYSIILARMTDQESYDKLTNKGKLSAKKTTFYKVFHNIDWAEENSAKKIIENLAENHDLNEETVKGLVKQATPLVFTELNNLTQEKPIPEYLQKLLMDDTTIDDDSCFIKFIPSWGLLLLPKNHVASKIFQIDKTSIASEEPILEDNIKVEESKNKNFPNPVHADPSSYSYENLTNPDSLSESNIDTSSQNEGGNIKKLFPIIGLLIFASLAWALLRSCQESGITDINKKQPTVSVSSDGDNVTVVTTENDTDNTAISQGNPTNKTDDNNSLINISVDNEGKLKNAAVLSSSNASSFKVNSTIANIFGESALNSTEVSIDHNLNENTLSQDNLKALLLLLQSVPNAKIGISGNDIYFDAPSERALNKLTVGAKNISSELSVHVGSLPNVATTNDDNSSSNKKIDNTPEIEKNSTETNLLEHQAKKITNPESANNKSDTDINSQENKIDSKAAPKKPDETKIMDVDTAISDSIEKSQRILSSVTGTDNQNDIKAIESALNTQIINFSVNGDDIPEINKTILNKAAAALKDIDARLIIIGHTDSDGNQDYNQRLSQDRSFSVKKYLMSQGISSKRMTTKGIGEKEPIASNSTPEGKFKNRRIEFKVIKINSVDKNNAQNKDNK